MFCVCLSITDDFWEAGILFDLVSSGLSILAVNGMLLVLLVDQGIRRMKRCILIMNLAIAVLIFGATVAHALDCGMSHVCYGRDTHMSCGSGATCYGLWSQMDCDSGAQCYGLWSQMSCDSGANCYSIGTSHQKPTCDVSAGSCRLIDITKQNIQDDLANKINAIGKKANPSPYLCILYYDKKEGYPLKCIWRPNQVDVHKAVELMNASFHVSHFQCSLRKDLNNAVVCLDPDIVDVLNLTVKLI